MIQLISAFLSESHEFVEIALWMSVVLTTGIGLLLVYLVWLRLRDYRKNEIRAEVQNTWEPIFRAMRSAVPVSKPELRRAQGPCFLALWLDQREHAQPAYRKVLQVLAESIRLEKIIVDLLRVYPVRILAPPASDVGIAVRAARYIDTTAIRDALRKVAQQDDASFAIGACESLLYLRDPDGIRFVLDLLFRYPEQERYLTSRLGVAGGEYLVRVLDPFLEKLPNARLEDIIQLMDRSDNKAFLPMVVRLLEHPKSDEELASLLRALAHIGNAAQRHLVVPYLSSEVSFIRLQAAVAMAAVGSRQDASLLLPMLGDPDWWVRYRSAQSFIALLGKDDPEVRQTMASHSDPYARDILKHVTSEGTWYTA